MKRPVLPFALFALLAGFFSLPGVGHASPFHSEEPLDAPAAAKRLADGLDGESRIVRLFYVLPEGRPFREEVVQKLKDEARFVQAWFGEQMEAHGFGYTTFSLETDEEGQPRVYLPGEEAPSDPGVQVSVIDNGSPRLESGVAGSATWWSKVGGGVSLPSGFTWDTLAHELGHAFGMGHDFRDDTYIMSYGLDERNVLSECAARYLAVDPQFNPDVGIEWGEPPTVELLSPPTYPEGAQSVPIRLKVSDPDGLHTLRLRVPTRWTHRARIGAGGWELKLCRDLMGAEEAEVEIEYDGVIPSGATWNLWDLSDPKVHPISLAVYNSDGNYKGLGGGFELWEVSRQHLATFEPAGQVQAVAFASEEGSTLASGSTAGIGLWDLETRTGTPISPSGATAVALSPDGGILASADSGGEIQLLDLASDQVVATFSGHTPPIRSLAFSPDGRILAAGAADAIRLWDRAAQTRLLLPVEAAAIAFSPDGERLVSGAGYEVQLWDLATQTDVRLESAAGLWTLSVAFSPDGTWVAAGADNSTVELWDVATGQSVAVLKGQGVPYGVRPVRSVAFSPDGTLLAFGLELGVNVWDPISKRHLATLQGEGREINTVAFSPDRTTLAAGTQDGKIGLWDVSPWRQPRPGTLVKISGDDQQARFGTALAHSCVVEVRDQYEEPLPGVEVLFTVTEGEGILGGQFAIERVRTDTAGRAETSLTLGPDPGSNIVEAKVAGLDELLRVMFTAVGTGTPSTPVVEGGAQTWRLPTGATARLGKGNVGRGDRAIVFSPDGRLLAVGTAIGIWLYEVATSREVALLPTGKEVYSLAFSPDGHTLASGESYSGLEGMVRVWDLATGETIATLDSADAVYETAASGFSLAFFPDGATLAVSSKNGVKVWDPATQSILATYDHRGTGGQAGPILTLSADGTLLASGADDGTIRLWDLATGDLTVAQQEHTDEVTSLSFSPDGTILVSASRDHTIRLWDTATGDLIDTWGGHTSWVFSVAFSPDGTTVASGSSDDTIRLWDAATGDPVASPFEDRIFDSSVAFSPEGTALASWSTDGNIKLWEVATGSARIVGKAHTAMVWSLALSPDGTRLASGYGYGTIRLWDVASGTQTAQWMGHGHRINSLVFSADGNTLVSGSSDSTVALWDLDGGTGIHPLKRMDAEASVSSVALSPDGRRLASGHYNGPTKLWDLETGTHTVLDKEQAVNFSPDGSILATGSSSRIRLWDTATGTQTATYDLDSDTDRLLSLLFSPNNDALVLGRLQDGTAELWDLAADTTVATIPRKAYSFGILAGALSPDQSLFVFSTSDRNRPTVDVWDFGTETSPATLYGHGDQIDRVTFSSRRIFASGSQDGTILVWDLQRVLPHPSTLTKLAGVKQQGLADSTLASPFVVSVLDQNGNPFVGATVTFEVTAGGGTLSVTAATTDENGRAATTLTLGSDPGRNTVTAKVPELNPVIFGATGQGSPRALALLSGDQQEGPAGTVLPEPFVVQVRDQSNNPLAGVHVAFVVTSGEGTVSVATDTTDAHGRAATLLTLGGQPGTHTVLARVGERYRATFTALAQATADFDGDGETGFSDFFLFADAFGGTDPRFDLDGSGSVDFADFFLFADYFEDPARGKLLALARELIGLPDGPHLQQNHPNPFNSETVISWFQLTPGPARLEVFALTGQRVAVLHQGPKKVGVHRLHWDGRDDQGRPVASGVHLYRLVTDEGVHTRKLTLLR